MLSSTFTAEEAHRTAIWLNSPQATEDATSRVIDKALTRIKARDESKKDSNDRKKEYHANKTNGEGEYPPKRYSQDNPPTVEQNGQPDVIDEVWQEEKAEQNDLAESASVPTPARKAEQETKIYRINGVDYTDPVKAAEAASKAIFG